MPWMGLNPLEFGGAIIKEAAEKYEKRDGFLDDLFEGGPGHGHIIGSLRCRGEGLRK